MANEWTTNPNNPNLRSRIVGQPLTPEQAQKEFESRGFSQQLSSDLAGPGRAPVTLGGTQGDVRTFDNYSEAKARQSDALDRYRSGRLSYTGTYTEPSAQADAAQGDYSLENSAFSQEGVYTHDNTGALRRFNNVSNGAPERPLTNGKVFAMNPQRGGVMNPLGDSPYNKPTSLRSGFNSQPRGLSASSFTRSTEPVPSTGPTTMPAWDRKPSERMPTTMRYNNGTSRIPGKDTGADTVPAMLRPGEAVLTKEAMEQPGMREFVAEMNDKHKPSLRQAARAEEMERETGMKHAVTGFPGKGDEIRLGDMRPEFVSNTPENAVIRGELANQATQSKVLRQPANYSATHARLAASPEVIQYQGQPAADVAKLKALNSGAPIDTANDVFAARERLAQAQMKGVSGGAQPSGVVNTLRRNAGVVGDVVKPVADFVAPVAKPLLRAAPVVNVGFAMNRMGGDQGIRAGDWDPKKNLYENEQAREDAGYVGIKALKRIPEAAMVAGAGLAENMAHGFDSLYTTLGGKNPGVANSIRTLARDAGLYAPALNEEGVVEKPAVVKPDYTPVRDNTNIQVAPQGRQVGTPVNLRAAFAEAREEPTAIDYARDSKAEAQRLGLKDARVLQSGDYGDQGGIVSALDNRGRTTLVGMSNKDVNAREAARVARVIEEGKQSRAALDSVLSSQYGNTDLGRAAQARITHKEDEANKLAEKEATYKGQALSARATNELGWARLKFDAQKEGRDAQVRTEDKVDDYLKTLATNGKDYDPQRHAFLRKYAANFSDGYKGNPNDFFAELQDNLAVDNLFEDQGRHWSSREGVWQGDAAGKNAPIERKKAGVTSLFDARMPGQGAYRDSATGRTIYDSDVANLTKRQREIFEERMAAKHVRGN